MPEDQVKAQPFEITIPQKALDDLHQRLVQTSFPDEIVGSGWSYGSNLGYIKELVRYWRTEFDWRRREEWLNSFAHFRTTIDGIGIHFLHERGKGPMPMPLVLTNGWPSSFVELLKIVPQLADPALYGGDPADAFDVIVPSLPGFGFSDRPAEPGMTTDRMASIWSKLMSEVLNYSRFGAHGTDLGGGVTSALGRFYSQQVIGIHLDFPSLILEVPDLSEKEQAYMAGFGRWFGEEGGYAHVQQTRPQTLAYGLTDSPVGLAAWIVEKFRAWTDCGGEVEQRFSKDELLTNISLYWFTQTINSSMRLYYENAHAPRMSLRPGERVEVPAAVALWGHRENPLQSPSQEFAERAYNVQRWIKMPRGGHFPAMEEPELLVEDIRAFFRPLRKQIIKESGSSELIA